MTDNAAQSLIHELGRRYLWWRPVGGLRFCEDRVVAQIMNFATYDAGGCHLRRVKRCRRRRPEGHSMSPTFEPKLSILPAAQREL
jgi:hypothetical protein